MKLVKNECPFVYTSGFSDIYYPVLVGIVVMWGVQVVGSYVLGISLGWGLVAMWAVFALDENIRGLIFLRRWNSFRWVGKGFLK